MRSVMPLLALLVVGCGGSSEEVPDYGTEEVTPEGVEKPENRPVTATDRAKGSWVIVVNDEEKRRQAIQLLAIADPPASAEDIAGLALTEDEQTQFTFTQMAVEQGDPEMVAEMREVIGNLDKARMVVTAETMTMSFGSVQDVAQYAVVNETKDGALIKSRREGEPEITYDLSFPDEKTMKLVNVAETKDTLVFMKVE